MSVDEAAAFLDDRESNYLDGDSRPYVWLIEIEIHYTGKTRETR